jgi:hypothetical protein
VALGVPGFVRIGAAIAGCALVAACTPDPGPTTTPTPVPPTTASATPSATPTETEIERQQRLDWEAAEAAYRLAVLESDRLAREGGVTKPSKKLSSVATDEFLELAITGLRILESHQWRYEGAVTILGVKRQGGWRSSRLNLVGCEDNSTWRILDKNDRDVTPKKQPDYIQSLVVKRVDRVWKVAELSTKKVSDVTASDCR